MIALRRFLVAAPLALAIALHPARGARAQDAALEEPGEAVVDPLDPFDILGTEEIVSSKDDDSKSAEELLRDGVLLLQLDRPLDARTKLIKALKKDPENFRAYSLLAAYYLNYVGHYRLALKYIKRAEQLFTEKYGEPPYTSRELRSEHSDLLYYISQIRLNLDNYEGALGTLDEFESLGYRSLIGSRASWYPGSRAWVLMKLGDIQEAIKVARLGVLAGDDGARTLNMLGILLSMNDQPQEALEVFRKAIAHEMSLGIDGQPGTPLNNSGEVYKEMFDDEKAESSFLRATTFRDGCEHILPSLNLALLYVDQLKLEGAASAMDAFDRCIAQYPLRNNEEHVALESLARGRVDLHTGNVARAIRRFETALDGTQWFGKIGTNQNDLLVASTISLAQALRAEANILRATVPPSWAAWAESEKRIAANSLRAWWLMRRARQMLIGELKRIEDLTIRNTDSLLEYPTLGDVLAGLSGAAFGSRMSQQLAIDKRSAAQLFYRAYAAQANRGVFSRSESGRILDEVMLAARPGLDELLKIQVMCLRMEGLRESSERYRDLAYRVFYTAAPELRNRALRLPVRIDRASLDPRVSGLIEDGPFVDGGESGVLCSITGAPSPAGGAEIRASFSCPGNTSKNRVVGDVDPAAVVNKLSDALFREEIQNGGNS